MKYILPLRIIDRVKTGFGDWFSRFKTHQPGLTLSQPKPMSFEEDEIWRRYDVISRY
jgi:hypothetical protein